MSHWITRHMIIGVATAAIVMLSCGVSKGAQVSGVALKVTLLAQPSNFVLSSHKSGEPAEQYVAVLTNFGSVASSGEVTLTDKFPSGINVEGTPKGKGWSCSVRESQTIVTCVYSEAVLPLAQSTVLTIPVAVSKPGVLTNRVEVTNVGAPVAVAERSTDAGTAPSIPPFEFLDFSSQAVSVAGTPDTRAGGHPFAIVTSLDFPEKEAEAGPETVVQPPRALEVELPAGLSGNPQAANKCALVALLAEECPPSSRIGSAFVNMAQGLFETNSTLQVYNMLPERGYPAEFGVYASRIKKLALLYASLGPAPDYRIRLLVPDVPATASLANLIATFFGNPQAIDKAGNAQIPFLTNPSDCSGTQLVTDIIGDSWEVPGRWVVDKAEAPPVAGCNLLHFGPSISVSPESTLVAEPVGYMFDLNVPQSPQSIEALTTPPVKNTTVTLPQDVSLSPSAADGLVACPANGPEGINLSSSAQGGCPLASEIGTAEATTPLLAEPLHGQLYVARPGCGGAGQPICTDADALDGNLFGLYLQLEGSGVVIKVHGTVSANPATGQLTATFKETPQQPFSDLKLKLKGGPRAPLANPQTCGEAITSADITPWSSPETPDATPSFPFTVTGCGGPAFAPTFVAGTTSTMAGAYTNFSTTFSRSDGMQNFSMIQVHIPPGLLGSLSHVSLCEEPQAAEGACSSGSRIGTATVSVGAGSHPFWVSCPVYLTGPYKGAPFGLSVAVPAAAGPFNLGTDVVRSALNIDPVTSALTITSDTLPQVRDGVSLRVQTVNVTVDRPQFMFNPTNCEAKQITATLVSAQGVSAQESSPFAAGGCKNLPFNPGFKVSTRAPGSRKKGTSFDVKVSSAPGQANIHSVSVSLPKQLPSRLTTIQQACPEATFAANPATCPVGSLIGIAQGTTPVLPVLISGPAYLVSHGGAAFPNLELVLQGEGVRVDLTGNINIAHGITSSTFANIPDVPISSFDLRLPEGRYSALTPNGNLCAKPLKMPTTLVGQNGRRLVRTTKIAVAGCPKVATRAKKAIAKGRTKGRGNGKGRR